jgi:hypothetical protein
MLFHYERKYAFALLGLRIGWTDSPCSALMAAARLLSAREAWGDATG